ncbi:hypothetical protein DW66_4162 [Pseudomonas putida]|nr:hypothetical protein DW66_4162 [Pseudomonas putida]AJG12283.1 hypothetical protein RK21_00775 [Pseudomonas plecoglossicida]
MCAETVDFTHVGSTTFRARLVRSVALRVVMQSARCCQYNGSADSDLRREPGKRAGLEL